MLSALGVSTSGYYESIDREPSKQELRKESIKEKIDALYHESEEIYGAPKITKMLRADGEIISERTVGKYMREMGIKAVHVKPYTVTTISKDFTNKLVNVLDRNFNPATPNAAWCTDITYIWTNKGFVYLSCVMDLFSRKIISWELSNTLETKYVVNAIEKAKRERKGVIPKIIHTDRGVQYTSGQYREATNGIELSYSAKGNPWDNACIESFHALIKREWLNRFKIEDYNHAYSLIFSYINAFYNTRRIHSHCNYMSPQQYEDLFYSSTQTEEKSAA